MVSDRISAASGAQASRGSAKRRGIQGSYSLIVTCGNLGTYEEIAGVDGGGMSAHEPGAQAVPVIFDTDMGNDVDDALALAMLHALESRGECRLIGVTVTKDNPWAPVFVDLVNTFYGRGEIPVGMVKGGVTPENSKMIQAPSERRRRMERWFIRGVWPAAPRPRRRSLFAALAGGGKGRERGHRAGRLQHESGAPAGCAGGFGPGPAQSETAGRDGGQLPQPKPEFNVQKDTASRASCSTAGRAKLWPAASRSARP